MGHTLSLTDGATAVSLVASGVMLRHYVPRTPETGADGRIGEVSEPVEIMVYGDSGAAVGEKIASIERILLAARRRYWTGHGPRVFVQLTLAGGVVYRSELVGGSLELEKDALTAYGQYKVGARLLLTRQGFWEGPRTALPLSNRNGADVTGGLTVYNRGNGQDNWFAVAGAAVNGSLPAPLELRMVNNTGASRFYRNFHIANNTFGPALAHIIEGETANPAMTVTADATASGGQYASFTGLSGSFQLEIDGPRSALVAGRRVHVLARFTSLPLNVNVWAQTTVFDFAGITPLYSAPETLLRPTNALVHNLGTVPLPPTAYDTSGPTLKLRMDVACASAATVGLDYVQLTPSDDLCYRHLMQGGYAAPNGAAVVDDGIEGLSYLQMGGVNYPLFTARTQPCHLFPGVDQRVSILHDGDGMSINWTLAVQAWYRPRRVTL